MAAVLEEEFVVQEREIEALTTTTTTTIDVDAAKPFK